MSRFSTWLKEELTAAQLDEETFCGYVEEILKDESASREDKKASLDDFLNGAASFRAGFVDQVLNKWEEDNSQTQTSSKKEISFDLSAYAPPPPQKFGSAQAGASASGSVKSGHVEEDSKFRRKQKEMLLEKYGYEILEHFDEDGEVTYVDTEANAVDPAAGLERHDNAAVVQLLQQKQRDEAKAKHEAELARNKELQEKQQREKEKERKRTMKKEHRRM